VVADFNSVTEILKGRCHGNEILHLRAKLHKIEHNSGPVDRSFKIFAASVGFLSSRISILLPKF